jgi:hypothetical protein
MNESSNKANAFYKICLQTFGLRCKGTIKFADVQILQSKVYSLKCKGKETV